MPFWKIFLLIWAQLLFIFATWVLPVIWVIMLFNAAARREISEFAGLILVFIAWSHIMQWWHDQIALVGRV